MYIFYLLWFIEVLKFLFSLTIRFIILNFSFDTTQFGTDRSDIFSDFFSDSFSSSSCLPSSLNLSSDFNGNILFLKPSIIFSLLRKIFLHYLKAYILPQCIFELFRMKLLKTPSIESNSSCFISVSFIVIFL